MDDKNCSIENRQYGSNYLLMCDSSSLPSSTYASIMIIKYVPISGRYNSLVSLNLPDISLYQLFDRFHGKTGDILANIALGTQPRTLSNLLFLLRR